MHASTIQRLFRNAVLASIAGGVPAVSVLACSGGPGPNPFIQSGSSSGSNPSQGSSSSGEDPTGASSGKNGGSSGQSGSGGACTPVGSIDAPTCGDFTVQIADPSACQFDGGQGSDEDCAAICGPGFSVTCTMGNVAVLCHSPCAVDGRRYTILDDTCAPLVTDRASYLARLAFFEAASVDAFTLLARELASHGAPRALVRSCHAARKDEIRHARMARTIASRHHASVPAPPSLGAMPARDLEAIAIENAVEGCVRETFGALIGLWQSEHAPSAELRAFFGALANDEARHAALAHRVDAWILGRLALAARARVEAARTDALAALERSLEDQPVEGLGLPTPAQARSLFASFFAPARAA